jgi:hypothetical protein
MNAPGYRTIEHLSRTRRLDTYEVWSEERACSCVDNVLRPDRRDDERARTTMEHEGRLLVAPTRTRQGGETAETDRDMRRPTADSRTRW